MSIRPILKHKRYNRAKAVEGAVSERRIYEGSDSGVATATLKLTKRDSNFISRLVFDLILPKYTDVKRTHVKLQNNDRHCVMTQ